MSLKVFRCSEIEDVEDGFTDVEVSLIIFTNKLHLVPFLVIGEVELVGFESSKRIVGILDVFDLMNLECNHTTPP
jgi:hypothetical protein